MAIKQQIQLSELSSSEHEFCKYHFCRGNSNKRKSRFGLIEKGKGTYMYLNKKLDVSEGDIVFIPEKIFCYSEWRGTPDIKVTYISCFLNYSSSLYEYEPQRLCAIEEDKNIILRINSLLKGDFLEVLEAYSLFYALLKDFYPFMTKTKLSPDKDLQKAIAFIMNNYNKDFSVPDMAKECHMCESKIYRLFREKLGQTPISYLNSIKINYAIEYLEKQNYSVSEISRMVNFKSETHFRKVFYSVTGTTPLKYRKSL